MTNQEYQKDKDAESALEMIRSENPHNRSAAVEQLGRLRTGLDDLQLAATDRNGYVRAAVADAMGNFSKEEVALYLGDMLWDDNPFVRSAAIRSLGRVGAAEYSNDIQDA